MITCQRHHLEARCRERGYTLEQVRPCIIAEDGDTITVDELHKAYPHIRHPGPGTALKAILSRAGIKASPTCSCSRRAKVMDEKGIGWCEENVETICDWLAEESARRKLPFVRAAGKALIYMAIRRAKKGNKQ